MAILRAISILVTLIVTHSLAVPSYAWLLYHKPSYMGKIIDADTKKPIEGFPVVVRYHKRVYGLVGSGAEVFDIRESITDNNGIFLFKSYTTLIDPISGDDMVSFIFYKPGYSHYHYPLYYKSYVHMGADEEAEFFSKNFGKMGRLYFNIDPTNKQSHSEWHDVIYGIIQVPKLITNEERIIAERLITETPIEFLKRTPIYNKLCNEERAYLHAIIEDKQNRNLQTIQIGPKRPPIGKIKSTP
jgi:hypothetical protein